MFVFNFDNKRITARYEHYHFLFDYNEIVLFTHNCSYRDKESQNVAETIDVRSHSKQFMTADETLVYLGCFDSTRHVENFILRHVLKVCII